MIPSKLSRLPIAAALLIGAMAAMPTNAGCGCTIAYGSGWEERVRCCDPSSNGFCEVQQVYGGQVMFTFYITQTDGNKRCEGNDAEAP